MINDRYPSMTTVFDTVSLFLGRFTSESINDNSSTIDLGLDSIHLSELEFELQRVYPKANLQFGFTIRLSTIGEIVKYVEGRMGTTRVEERRVDLHRIPLSAVQRRILFLSRLHPENSHQFGEKIAFSAVNIDRRRLEKTLRMIVMRHSILRMCYEAERQFALSATECHFSIDESGGEHDNEFIDIEKEPPIRVRLQRSSSDFCICISLHHIAVDGRSIGVFLQELKMIYGSPSQSSLPRQKQYIDDLLDNKNENSSQLHHDYWKQKLAGLDTQLLHTDFRRLSTPSVEGKSMEIPIPQSLMSSLHSLRRQSGSTTFAALLSLYRLFIYKSAGYDDFPLGVMVENRNEKNRETIGCFVNSCVLRSRLNSSSTFTQFTREIQQNLHEMRDHSSLPFDDVVSAVQADSDEGTSPLFQILFVMDNVSIPSNDGFKMIKVPSNTAKYEQTWYITNYGSEMSIKVEYRTDLFNEKTIRRSIDFVLFLLQRMAEEPEIRINEISLMRPIDYLQYHVENKTNKQDYPDLRLMLTNPAKGTVRFKDTVIPTKKMVKKSRRIARVLREEYFSHYGESNRPDDFLVIFVERSKDLIPLMLGGLEAGFCLAPISLDWSIDRRRQVMTTIENALYVTDGDPIPDTHCLRFSSVMEKARKLGKTRRRVLPVNLPSDILYATFTSGTTGVAKCVCNSGEGMGNLMLNYTKEYSVGAHSSVYQVINYAFDIFFCDIFLALVNDADLTLASGAIPERKEMERAKTTHCFVMPAFLNFSEDVDLWANLDTALVTGETMQSKAFRNLLTYGVPLHQLYGATEQTINNTSQRLHMDSPRRAVGKTYRNLGIRTVDKDGQPIPHCWPALLRYSGPGLARGVFGQMERSQKMFPIDDVVLRERKELNDDGRCFDSGDLLRRGDDENLVFVGRNDHLRKVRGRAVDLREIEHHLSSIPQVSGCLVRISNDSLIAYAVSQLQSDEIKKILAESLPSYMVPEHILILQRFPTNANGKIDVKALPEPELSSAVEVNSIVEPRNTLESQLSGIFESLLKKKISISDDFFSFGGNSLLAMLAVQKIESELSLTLPLKRFFQLRTIASIAESLQDKESSGNVHPPTGEICNVTTQSSFRIPLSLQQRHLWFQCSFDPESDAGDIAMRIKMPDGIAIPRLQSIINTLIIVNNGLRTTMRIEESLPVQYALSATECFYCIGERGNERILEKLSIHNRISIGMRRDGKELLLRLHHILVDGRSLAILHDQLRLLMEGRHLTHRRSFLSCCSSQSFRSDTIGEWKNYLAGASELNLPGEKTGKNGHSTVVHKIAVDKNLMAECVKKHECTPFHLLFSSFISTLHRLSSQNDFTIGVVHAGRRAETHDVVGLFVNTLPVRVREGKMDMEAVKEMVDFPFAHCTSPLGEIVQAVNPKRISGRHPLFQHVINLQNASGSSDGTVDYEHATETAFDTCWKIEENEGGFVARIDYNRGMFGEEFVRRAAGLFERNLRGFIRGSESIEEVSAQMAVKEVVETTDSDAEIDVDEVVRRSWTKNLGVESLNDDDNFFDVGGHSLIALAVINELSGLIGKEVPLRLIFEHQTLGEFVHCIRELMDTKKSVAVRTTTNSLDPKRIRASRLQVPLLEHMRNNGSESFVKAYNITARIRLKQDVSREELRFRFNRLCLRHPSLRTFFVFDDDAVYQRAVSATECFLPCGFPLEGDGAFDVFDSPPIAVSLQGGELRICISHLNVDGHSMKTIVKELAGPGGDDYCEEFIQLNRELQMKPTPEGTAFWKKILSGFVFNPLRSNPRSSNIRLDASSITKEYLDLGRIINQICSTHHCTPFSVLLSSLGATLLRHSLQRKAPVSIGWPVDLRSSKTEKTIGFATNTFVTTVDSFDRSPQGLIQDVSQQVIGALEHRSTSFDELLKISGSSSLFDAMLVMDPFSVDDGEEFEVINEKQPFTKFPVTFFVQYSNQRVRIIAHFMKDLFHPTTIESILDEWEETLNCWTSGDHLKLKSRLGEGMGTIIKRQGQFVPVEDLAELCTSIGRCKARFEYGRMILEYDSSVTEEALINHIKRNVPLCLHPDELQSCPFVPEIPPTLPLTPQQLQMFFLSREDSSGHYNVPFVQRFNKSSVNVRHLVLALHYVRQSNEALRTRLVEEDGEPRQIVVSATESYYQIRTISVEEDDVKIRLHSPAELTLDLAHSPARMSLFVTGEDLVLLLVISHVICDGWSTSLMQQQLSSVYESLQSGQKPKLAPRKTQDEYAKVLNDSRHGAKIDEDYLEDVVVSLPALKCVLEKDDGVELIRTLNLDKSSSLAMNKRTATLDSTPFNILVQSIAESIHSTFGIERVNIGTPVANRTSSTVDVIGCFMNTIVVPVHSTDSTASKSIHSSLALNVPNFHLLKVVRSRLNQADLRLFDVFVNCRYGMESERNVRVEGVRKSEIHKMTSIYPLEFYIEEENGEYEIEVKMKRGNNETIEKLVETLRNILSHREDEVSVESPSETSWTSTAIHEDIPSLDLSSILHLNSRLNGDGVAIRTPQRELNYSELWRMLSSGAFSIREEFFSTTGEVLRADDVVGVRMQHGEDAILACLSILVAGAAYLPLLESWPEERIRHAVDETGCGLVIERMGERMERGPLATTHRIGNEEGRWMRRNLIEDAAYVIYTSGTTGKPKGVVAVHRGVVNMLSFTIQNLSMRTDDVIFQFTKFVFDNSVLEIWLALASGSTLFIDNSPFNHNSFISSIQQYGITHALLFPGLVAAFSDTQLSLLSSLRAWCMGAEKASQPLVDKAIDMGINIVQVYGPTETTTYALSRFMKRGDHANNLGKGLTNTMLRVKYDEEKSGQLFITGDGLMRGYVGRTREESFTDGFYATGDVVRVQNDGTVIFVGRNDGQVKVRGYRIELNEVENALLKYVEQVKVLLIEEQQQLVAFVKSSLSASQLRSHCASLLPDYMIPSRFISLTKFPLTDNAKVDVTTLRNMVNTRSKGDERDKDDKSKTDQRFLEVLKRIGFRFVTLDDNFIEIGGQSIIAMRLIAEIEKEFGVTLLPHDLYRTKTLRELIPLLSKNSRTQEKTHSQVVKIDQAANTAIQVKNEADMIRRIWKSMLSTETFSDDDNFFLVGGDSFKLLKLHNKFVQEFGLNLSLADLLHNLTIKQARTLVLLHPLIGGVQMPYRNLIAQLANDYEIIGIEHPQTFTQDSTAPQFNSLVSLVKSYVESHKSSLMKSMTKMVFIGASLGSLLAFEMASQLGVETDVIVIDGTSNQTPTPLISLEEHRSMMIGILEKYKVEDSVLINHMIYHSWQLYLLSSGYQPIRNERISVHVFSCCETDLNWSEIALLKSIRRLTGDHSEILNPSNSSLVAQFIQSLH